MYMLRTALTVLLFSALLFSQANFGRILGTVTDQSGGVVSGATVSITDTQRGLARTLTTLHGGTVSAASDGPGRGSEFTVRLPASKPAVQPIP